MSDIKPWGPFARGLLELIVRDYLVEIVELEEADARTRIGSRLDYDKALPFYIRIDQLPGRSDQLGGFFVFDVEVFAQADSGVAESVAGHLEALLLGYPHVVEVDDEKLVFDRVTQNTGPHELPWEDDGTDRLGATYVITARR